MTSQSWHILWQLVHLNFSFICKLYTELCKNNHIIPVLYTLDKVQVHMYMLILCNTMMHVHAHQQEQSVIQMLRIKQAST
jgi:hypothetical protein